MNVQYKRAVFSSLLFGSLLIYMCANFYLKGTVDFIERSNFIITAIMIFLAMVLYALLIFITGKDKKIIDERDEVIQHKATTITLLLQSTFVFIVLVFLFIIYEDTGFVPISWVWFMAYTTAVFAFFSSSVIIVIQYWRN